MTSSDLEKVKQSAKDLRKTYPRSPREKLGGYVIAARCVDKCRAFLVNMNGEYNYWALFLSKSMVCVYRDHTGAIPASRRHRSRRRRHCSMDH